jgi:acetyltransferase-like isoleucine patch superfamily enzyme
MFKIINITVRKLLSAIRIFSREVASFFRILYIKLSFPDVIIPFGCAIGSGTVIEATDGGRITFEKRVVVGSDVRIISRGGFIKIGKNTEIGPGSAIISQGEIIIGGGCLIAEYVVIRDQDHVINTLPFRLSGFEVSNVLVGDDCWLASKSTVLRGSVIGNGVVLAAHAVTRGHVPPFSLAAGCPAVVKRRNVSKSRPQGDT